LEPTVKKTLGLENIRICGPNYHKEKLSLLLSFLKIITFHERKKIMIIITSFNQQGNT
jgi:hypothetical protein